jgi:OmpA-OmpF porin, OOP family
MHQPAQWWKGLGIVAILGIVGAWAQTEPVRIDLFEKAVDAARTASPDTASALKFAVDGRDVYVDGLEFEPGQGRKIGAAVADRFGVRLVSELLKMAPEPKPFVFGATHAGDTLTLTGFVSTPAEHDKVIIAARVIAQNLKIVDKLNYGRGAPDAFEQLVNRGMLMASRLDNSEFGISDRNFSIAGDAPNSTMFEAAVAATQALPGGAVLAKADIRPPETKPYAWSVTSDGVAATIAGVAPSIEARRAIAAAASRLLPGKMIEDRMQIARGAPSGDFGAATEYALGELGHLASGRVAISDTAISIVGEAGTSQAWDEVVAAATKPPAGFSVARADIRAPEVKPYVWSATNDGARITISGLAPTGAIRDSIRDAAAKAFPGKTIVSDMGIARGAPDGDFAALANYALGELSRLSTGEARLNDKALTITGDAASPESYEAAVEAAKTPPAGFVIADARIGSPTIRPYVFKVEKTDAGVRLSGYAPDEKARQELLAAARTAFFADSVSDDLKLGAGAPAGFVAAAKATLPSIARLASGALTMSDTGLRVDGAAVYGKAADDIRQALAAAMPGGFKLDANVEVAPPGAPLAANECQPRFAGILSKGRILFETGKAAISHESAAVLDGLVGLVQRCADADIEVAGHTDSVGSAASNLDLSKRRAEAVVAYLKDAGVDTSRITAAGYGETKPIASNDTDEGRAQNRRIEFVVK